MFRTDDRVVFARGDSVRGTVTDVEDGESAVSWDDHPEVEPRWYDNALLRPAPDEEDRIENGLSAVHAPEIQHLEYTTELDPSLGSVVPVRDRDYGNGSKAPVLITAQEIYDLFPGLQLAAQEHMVVGILDTRQKLLGWKTAHKGVIDSVEVSLREILGDAHLLNGRFLVMLHNHPSGDPEPSDADRELTQAVVNLGRDWNLDLLDHIVVGRAGNESGKLFYSFREAGELPEIGDG